MRSRGNARTGWDPWRELRYRPHLHLTMRRLPAHTGGGLHLDLADGHALIVLCATLTQVERNAILAHELVHDERGGGCRGRGMPNMWGPVILREERIVDGIVADRLVPPQDLVEWCVARGDEHETVTAADVAHAWHVTLEVAERALAGLAGTTGAAEAVRPARRWLPGRAEPHGRAAG